MARGVRRLAGSSSDELVAGSSGHSLASTLDRDSPARVEVAFFQGAGIHQADAERLR